VNYRSFPFFIGTARPNARLNEFIRAGSARDGRAKICDLNFSEKRFRSWVPTLKPGLNIKKRIWTAPHRHYNSSVSFGNLFYRKPRWSLRVSRRWIDHKGNEWAPLSWSLDRSVILINVF
jgi:hypothetical protein